VGVLWVLRDLEIEGNFLDTILAKLF
jgi:hypothetical protein